MAARPAKRARATTNGDIVPPLPPPTTVPSSSHQIPNLVWSLDAEPVFRLLIQAAQKHPDVAALVVAETERLDQIEKARFELESRRVVDFDYHSKSVWREINMSYGSRQYGQTGDAYRHICSAIQDIKDRCPTHASLRTKQNALETLRKIGKTICLSDGVIGREIQELFDHEGNELEETMTEIIEGLKMEDMNEVLDGPGDVRWEDKLKELVDIALDHGLFPGLEEVLEHITVRGLNLNLNEVV